MENLDYSQENLVYSQVDIFSIVIIIFGVILLGFLGLFSIVKQINSSSWPTIEAEVISTDGMDKGEIEYQYVVNDRVYHSKRLAFFYVELNERNPERALARSIARRYPVGSTIIIHYDPDNPESAVLGANDTDSVSNLLCGFSFFLLIMLAGILQRVFKR